MRAGVADRYTGSRVRKPPKTSESSRDLVAVIPDHVYVVQVLVICGVANLQPIISTKCVFREDWLDVMFFERRSQLNICTFDSHLRSRRICVSKNTKSSNEVARYATSSLALRASHALKQTNRKYISLVRADPGFRSGVGVIGLSTPKTIAVASIVA